VARAAQIPIRDRLPRFGVVTGIVAVILILAGLVFLQARHPGFASVGAVECERSYRRARSSPDTAIVDLQIPATGREKGPNAPSCGFLRRSGELR
jgi:hypothetical protein